MIARDEYDVETTPEKEEINETWGGEDTEETEEAPEIPETWADPVDNTPTTPYNQTQEDWLKGSAGDEVYNQEGLLKDQNTELESLEDNLDELNPSLAEKILMAGANYVTGGLAGATVDILQKIASDSPVTEAEKELVKSQLKVDIEKKKEQIRATESRINELNDRIAGSSDVVDRNTKDGIDKFVSEKGRQPSSEERIAIVNQAIDQADPTIQNKIASANWEKMIKGYNPNADMDRFSQFNPESLTDSALLQESLRQGQQLQGKQAEAQAIRDNTLKGMEDWTKLDASTRDAWKEYYDPSKYQATAGQSGRTVVDGASQVGGDYKADLSSLKGYDPKIGLTNQDSWKNYFKGVDGYEAQATTADRTQVAPALNLTGDYQADLEAIRGFDPTIQASEERARAVKAGQMMEDRATGKAPSVAELSYLSNLDRMMAQQQGATASQRGASGALAQRAVAQQSAGLQQQAVRDTAIARAEEQRQAEIAMAAQANQVMMADQQKSAQEKQLQLQQKIEMTNQQLSNAKMTLEKDMFNADAQNKVTQLQAQLDSDLAKYNSGLETNVELANISNQMSMTQYAGGQEQQKMLTQLQADTQSKANELQQKVQYTEGLLKNAQNELSKDQFNADAQNKVKILQSQLDSEVERLNAQLQTQTSLANASNNLQANIYAGQQAQQSLLAQLAQERTDTMSKYGVNKETLGTEIDIISSLQGQLGQLGAAEKGWQYQQQGIDQQKEASDNAFYGNLITSFANAASQFVPKQKSSK